MQAVLALVLISGVAVRPTSPESEGAELKLDLLGSEKMAGLRAILPVVQDGETMAALTSRNTIWYDDETMPPTYQDAVFPIVGIRTTDNVLAPAGFFENGHFRFPWGHTAGTHRCDRVRTVKFLTLPVHQGALLPVVYWREDSGYHWIFPKGTLVGEVMILDSAEQGSFVFEIRVRRREIDHWQIDAFRPFPTAQHLVRAIRSARPRWLMNDRLYQLVEHLNDPHTLERATLDDDFGAFQAVGAVDTLPPIDDDVVADVLRQTPFRSSQGEVWKRDGDLECHAPTTEDDFSVVPARYDAGVVAVDEMSCARCHRNTAQPIGEFQPENVLYGTIWGSDQIFSWHPFDPDTARGNVEGLIYSMRQSFLDGNIVEEYDSTRHRAEDYATIE